MAPDADIRLFLMETMWTTWREIIFTIPMGATATITGRFISHVDCFQNRRGVLQDVLEVDRLSVRFGEVEALRDVIASG